MRLPGIISYKLKAKVFLAGKCVGVLPIVHFRDLIHEYEIFMSQNRWEIIISSGQMIEFPTGWKKYSFVELYVRVPKVYRWWFWKITVVYVFNDFEVSNWVKPDRYGMQGSIDLETIDTSKRRLFSSKKDARVFTWFRWWFAFENYCKKLWEEKMQSKVRLIETGSLKGALKK